MDAPVTYKQIAKIHALANELGLDEELLHALVLAETKRYSIRYLTVPEAMKVIDKLQGMVTPKGMATPKQRRFIEGLLKNIGWVLPDGKPDIAKLEKLLKSKFQTESYNWLTVKKASEVIEALKDMKNRQQSTT